MPRARTKIVRTTAKWRRLALAFAVIAGASVLAAPAGAQFWEHWPNRQQAPAQQHDFFPFSLFGGHSNGGFFAPFGQPQRPMESIRPPPPRKVETPQTSMVLVIGDSLADWLAYGLEETFADTPEIGVVRKIRPTSGLVRYEPRNDSLEWSQAVKEMLATEKPDVIVVMLGLNDRLPLRAPPAKPGAHGSEQPAPAGQSAAAAAHAEYGEPQSGGTQTSAGTAYEFHTDKWAELYSKRVDDMMAALKSKGVPVVWVGLPAIRGTHGTTDTSYLDEIYRSRAEKAGVTYVDVWDGFVDEQGRYAQQGPDFEGQIRRLRTYDGVHFTKAGAVKLAHYVDHDLRRLLSNHLTPVALPAPDEQSPQAAPGARPAIGPVVPLGDIPAAGGDNLVGADNSAPTRSDPLASQVFSRGDALAAPPGRADNFSWPPVYSDLNPPTETELTPAAATPAAQQTPQGGKAAAGAPAKSAGKKPLDAKTDAKPDARTRPAAGGAADTAPSRSRRTRVDLDGAPRPPLPIGR
jgi:uncharacterized protein